MAITIQCACGRRTAVADALAGKTIRCPKCGQTVAVAAAAAAPAGARPARSAAPPRGALQPRAGAAPRAAAPAVHVSSGLIIKLSIVVVVVGFILWAYFGPVRVWNQWETIGPKAQSDVTDVVSFALQAYMSNNGMYDPTKATNQPGVEGPVGFFRPFLNMTMPSEVKFFGHTNQGPFKGIYNPRNGEITANISYGAVAHLAFGSDVGVKETVAGSFDITGREVNSAPQAEMNGQKMSIYFPPKESTP